MAGIARGFRITRQRDLSGTLEKDDETPARFCLVHRGRFVTMDHARVAGV
jgi:hypothetical protein